MQKIAVQKVSIKSSVKLETKALKYLADLHFTNNTLNNIQGALLDDNLGDVNLMLKHFSKIFYIIENLKINQPISLSTELQFLESYISIYKARLGGLLDFEINIETPIDSDQILIPIALFQPIIEHIVENKLKLQKTDRQLKINITKDQDALIITFFDNASTNASKIDLPSMPKYKNSLKALKILNKRIIFNNRYSNSKIQLLEIKNKNLQIILPFSKN